MYVKKGKTLVLPCGEYRGGQKVPEKILDSDRYAFDRECLQKADPFPPKKTKGSVDGKSKGIGSEEGK